MCDKFQEQEDCFCSYGRYESNMCRMPQKRTCTESICKCPKCNKCFAPFTRDQCQMEGAKVNMNSPSSSFCRCPTCGACGHSMRECIEEDRMDDASIWQKTYD